MAEKKREGPSAKAVVFPILMIENGKIVYRELLEQPDYGDLLAGRMSGATSKLVFGGWHAVED